jgi:uncharacterized protein (TIGR00251 family)
MLMIIQAKVKTNQKEFSVKKNSTWLISVKSPPEKGMANNEIVRELSKTYENVKIIKGLKSKKKLISLGNSKP